MLCMRLWILGAPGFSRTLTCICFLFSRLAQVKWSDYQSTLRIEDVVGLVGLLNPSY